MTTVPQVASASAMTRDGRPILIRSCQGLDELDACVQLQIDSLGLRRRRRHPASRLHRRQAHRRPGHRRLRRHPRRIPRGQPKISSVSPCRCPVSSPDPTLVRTLLSRICTRTCWPFSAGYRNDGIGRQLKLFQRIEALNRGIDLMEWTFDPLEIKNSFLNIHKLGAIVRTYTSNFYGLSSSRLQGGLPTDRLHAEWYLRSKRVQACLAGAPVHHFDIEETIMIPHQVAEWKIFGARHSPRSGCADRKPPAFSEGLLPWAGRCRIPPRQRWKRYL